MNTPTPTPRTDAAWSATTWFDGEKMSAVQTIRGLRECSQQPETELADAQPSDHYMSKRLERTIARAERAEVELATERARMDWVFRNCKVEANDYTTGNRDVYAIHDREDLGAAMKEDAK